MASLAPASSPLYAQAAGLLGNFNPAQLGNLLGLPTGTATTTATPPGSYTAADFDTSNFDPADLIALATNLTGGLTGGKTTTPPAVQAKAPYSAPYSVPYSAPMSAPGSKPKATGEKLKWYTWMVLSVVLVLLIILISIIAARLTKWNGEAR